MLLARLESHVKVEQYEALPRAIRARHRTTFITIILIIPSYAVVVVVAYIFHISLRPPVTGSQLKEPVVTVKTSLPSTFSSYTN